MLATLRLSAFIVIFVSFVGLSACSKKGEQSSNQSAQSGATAVQQTSPYQPQAHAALPVIAPEAMIPAQQLAAEVKNSSHEIQSKGLAAPSSLGTSSVNSSASAGASAQVPAPAPVKVQECYSYQFFHKATQGHSSEVDCAQHKNLVELPHSPSKINKESVCVKVNGIPVKYKWAPEAGKSYVLLANIAGPKAKIETRYCLGKVKCADPCKVPKDEFLDAIGANDDDSAAGGSWGKQADNQKRNEQIKRELATFGEGSNAVFKDWEQKDLLIAESQVCTKVTEQKQANR